MASKIVSEAVTKLTCDMTKQDAVASRALTIDGVTYELDLSEASNEKLNKVLSPYMTKAHAVTPAPNVLREWAQANGFEVGARGRLHASIAEAYAKALRGDDTDSTD